MPLNWKSVTAEHVHSACKRLRAGGDAPRVGAKGIFVRFEGELLPAKHVARLAYRIANALDEGATLKFSSGDGLIRLLLARGATVERTDGKPLPVVKAKRS